MIVNVFRKILRLLGFKSKPTIRLANESDVEFVIETLRGDASAGHYNQLAVTERGLDEHKAMFINLIRGIGTPRLGESGIELISGILWVFEYENRSIGFAYICELFEGSGDDHVEINMISIAPYMRGKGWGKQLLVMLVLLLSKSNTISARCYPASQKMMSMLSQIGFSLDTVSESGISHFKLYNSAE